MIQVERLQTNTRFDIFNGLNGFLVWLIYHLLRPRHSPAHLPSPLAEYGPIALRNPYAILVTHNLTQPLLGNSCCKYNKSHTDQVIFPVSFMRITHVDNRERLREGLRERQSCQFLCRNKPLLHREGWRPSH